LLIAFNNFSLSHYRFHLKSLRIYFYLRHKEQRAHSIMIKAIRVVGLDLIKSFFLSLRYELALISIRN
jgi:hypothetical protein